MSFWKDFRIIEILCAAHTCVLYVFKRLSVSHCSCALYASSKRRDFILRYFKVINMHALIMYSKRLKVLTYICGFKLKQQTELNI